jgi:hypothetical protein
VIGQLQLPGLSERVLPQVRGQSLHPTRAHQDPDQPRQQHPEDRERQPGSRGGGGGSFTRPPLLGPLLPAMHGPGCSCGCMLAAAGLRHLQACACLGRPRWAPTWLPPALPGSSQPPNSLASAAPPHPHPPGQGPSAGERERQEQAAEVLPGLEAIFARRNSLGEEAEERARASAATAADRRWVSGHAATRWGAACCKGGERGDWCKGRLVHGRVLVWPADRATHECGS